VCDNQIASVGASKSAMGLNWGKFVYYFRISFEWPKQIARNQSTSIDKIAKAYGTNPSNRNRFNDMTHPNCRVDNAKSAIGP